MLKDVTWAEDRDYKTGTEDEPLQFYLDALCNSKTFDLLLGYFSSSALNVLSLGFANFICSGGKMRAIINNVLSEEDKEAIKRGQNKENLSSSLLNFNDIKELKKTLDEYGTHFFECFAWLIANNRIEIKIIRPKKGRGISHYKSGVFSDGENSISYKSSCNFTYYGFLENLEELECRLSWEDSSSNRAVMKQNKHFDSLFSEQVEHVEYLSIDEVKSAICEQFGNKRIEDLIVNEKELLRKRNNILKNSNIQNSIKRAIEKLQHFVEMENKPRFPYGGEPYDYQVLAHKKWLDNNKKGLFAMATGTGKTITSLNCMLNEYKEHGFYKFIVFVPTTALASQWVSEVRDKFNFQNIILCCSINGNWKDELKSIGKSVIFGRQVDYAIITTYATFKGVNFQSIFKDCFKNDFDKITMIADEAHTMGSIGFTRVLPNYIENRIGLSATPERQFDDYGNTVLAQYFDTSPDEYTFEYNMKIAIDNGVLCKYYYYPKIVSLEPEEQDEYLKISKELTKYINPETGKYYESEYVNNLLIKRKNVIHKASRKLNELVSIVGEIGSENFNNAFIYVPEGIEVNYVENDDDVLGIERENDRLIDNYLEALYDAYSLRMAKFTGETHNRNQILEQFKTNKLDALLAMKCLDEGVDIPQTKYAIFCSSTGNPRQYVQRRGRVLRRFSGKDHAIIYDLIVKPIINHTDTDEKLTKIEKNIFLSELRRLVNFAVLSENKDLCLRQLEQVCYDLDIDIYELANKELENYN
ncbi:DEAD/DEAH box helicase family protein [Mangrovimonas xylaniphaga]|uniref:DEAD/DEAH box helicase family protein n=1 Tax=Mangrovimonas xylaniphaga TaxID=1645915 RepID=UPI0006B52D72|nr:DEAD/DEAH box helicase family protein [Mangrovimonas xylaniphaga]